MRVLINGVGLDIPTQEITLHYGTFMFSPVASSSYSTDIDLPLTDNNRALLGVWGVPDRDGQLFGTFIPCFVLVGGNTYEGKLQVGKIQREVATVTVYFGGASIALLDKPLNRVLEDGASSIFDWEAVTLETSSDLEDDIHFTQFNDGKPTTDFEQANINVNRLFDIIGVNTGVFLPHFNLNYRLLCTRRKLCPHNTKQLIMWSVGAVPTVNYSTHGEHICVEFGVEGSVAYLRTNRACTINLYNQLRTDSIITSAGSVTVKRGTSLGSLTNIATLNASSQVGGVVTTQGSRDFDAGEYVVVEQNNTNAYTATLAMALTITDYVINEEDYDVDMAYNPSASYAVPSWVQGDFGFLYFGVYNNLPAVKVGELLNSLAWKEGRVLVLENGRLWARSSLRGGVIKAKIDAFTPYCSELGRVNLWRAANEEKDFAQLLLSNDFLEAEKVVHQSVFRKTEDRQVLTVPLYTFDESTRQYEFNELEGAVISKTIDFSAARFLATDNGYSTLGLGELSRVMAVEGVTDEKITEYEYIMVGGHKVLLIEYDVTENTGLTSFRGLLI